MEQEREDRFIIVRYDVLQSKDLTPSEKLVYARICGFKKYFESKEECAEMLGVSAFTVTKAKQKLLRAGYIKEIGNTGRGKIYQSVYDEDVRVVKSTNQSGKKDTSRVVKSTNIEEIENKERVKSITNVIGETPEKYGNGEINDLFDYWRMTVGYEIQAKTQRNRYACSNLLKKHGIENLKRLIHGVALSQQDKYAPRISDFITLQSRYNELVAWGKTNVTTKRGVSL